MSQHDLSIANQGFPAFRSDLNDALQALGTNNSGATAPSTTYANQLWYDTANNILKIRNEDNDAWISLITLDQTGDAIASMAIPAVSGSVNFDSNTLVVDATNNRVGVGTASPTYLLDVLASGATSATNSFSVARITGASSVANDLTLIGPNTSQVRIKFGDTDNAGIGEVGYNHSTNAMRFVTNDSEKMVIDSSGNVGISNTSPSSYNGSSDNLVIGSSGSNGMTIVSGTSNAGYIMFADGTTGQQAYEGQITYDHSSNFMSFNTTANERMRIDSSGRLLVNRSATGGSVFDTCNVQVTGNISISRADPELILQNTGTDARVWRILGSTSGGGTAALRFYDDTASAERMRITSSGRVLVNNTTSFGGMFQSTGLAGAVAAMGARVGANGDGALEWWNASGGYVASVTVNASSVAYNTTSDYRLKENVTPMTGALAKVSQLKPVTYTWKIDGSNGQGFIAHELAEIVPDCVSGEKDAVNEDGSIKPQQIDTSFLVATLTAALQELKAEVDSLKAQLNA